jgi:NAD(P)-dependent dehydrogenase (short-subunit alcohol dehydrogenase family)
MQTGVCAITGSTSGIGKETARSLAKMGFHVLLIGRNEKEGASVKNEIMTDSGNPNIDFLLADLSSQADIRRLAGAITTRYSSVHALINNAGIAPLKRSVSVDGIERTFAVNYLAPFILTNLLLERLKASAPARVVNVAGDFHRKATIQFDDLMSEKEYNGIRANNQAKLALILFTYELARRLDGTGVTANCLHPGAVATDGPLKDPDLPAFSRGMYKLVRLFFASPAKGAETSVYLSTSPEVEKVTGKYFIKKTPVASSPESYDEGIAQRLWKVSEELTGLAP